MNDSSNSNIHDKFHPHGYNRISRADYKEELDKLANNDDSLDKHGLEKDNDEKEYLFIFKHPDLKLYVFDAHQPSMDFFGDILVRDFSYYSDSIMNKQLKWYDKVLKNLQDAYLGRTLIEKVNENCVNDSKRHFSEILLQDVLNVMSELLEKHKQSRDYDNYLSFYENVLEIEEDVIRPHPKFAFNFNFMKFNVQSNVIYDVFKKETKIGYYDRDLKKFKISLSSEQIGIAVANVIRKNPLIKTSQSKISQFIANEFKNNSSLELKKRTIEKKISEYKNPDRDFRNFKYQIAAIEFFKEYLRELGFI